MHTSGEFGYFRSERNLRVRVSGYLAVRADYNDYLAVLPPVSDGENGRLRV